MNSVEASNDGESTEAKTQFKKRRYQKTCESQFFKLNDRKNWPDHFLDEASSFWFRVSEFSSDLFHI